MNNVVFHLLRTERARITAFAFGFIRPNRVCGFEIKACSKQAFQDGKLRFVFVVMKRKGKNSARFHNSE